MNYCLFASKQGLLFESHALFEGVNIIGMGVNIVRIRKNDILNNKADAISFQDPIYTYWLKTEYFTK